MEKILVAMSGGVDSSVTAALLKKQGYNVIGITMQLWDYSKNKVEKDGKFDTCCSLDDAADARMVCDHLGIPFYILDYQEAFKSNVVDYFIEEYLKGQTPNPCVACNTFLKFDALMERAERLGCSHVATGHYARIVKKNGVYSLLQAKDKNKDQSYFLYSLTQDRLSKTLFPLGDFTKQEVRELAVSFGLPNAQKSESMDICFVPGNNYGAFIEENVDEKRFKTGNLVHESGEILAAHRGIHLFTVGQRKGIGVQNPKPLFVTRIDAQTGTVYVGEEEYLWKQGFYIHPFHHIRPLDFNEEFEVKIRYRSRPQAGRVDLQGEGRSRVLFSSPQKSVTPGQIAVLYRGEEVLGGGFIESVI